MTCQNDCALPNEILEQISEQGLEYLPQLIRVIVNMAMKAERQQYLGVAPYERLEKRRGQSNGFKPKTARTRMGEIEFAIPQVRGGEYYPQALEKDLRSERALTMTLAEMYVQGASPRKVNAIVEKLCGSQVSSSLVSKAASELDALLEAWRTRPLGEIRCLFLDARCEKAPMDGQVVDMAVLIAQAVDLLGKRRILKVFNAPDRPTADTYLKQIVQKCEPGASRLADWMENNLPKGLTVFAFPEAHRRKLRTNNRLERLNREIGRRTDVVSIFPNEAACLRLASALLMEQDEEWQTDRTYLSFEAPS